MPPALWCLTAENEDAVSCYFISLTNCTAEHLFVHREALKNSGKTQTQTAFAKAAKGVFHNMACHWAQRRPFPRLLWEGRQKKTLEQRRWLGQMLMAGLSPPAPPPASLHSAWVQSFTVDFFQAISSNYWWPAWDTFICIKLKLDLECAMGASIPSKAPDVLWNAQRTMTPLCSPRWNRGKPLLRA